MHTLIPRILAIKREQKRAICRHPYVRLFLLIGCHTKERIDRLYIAMRPQYRASTSRSEGSVVEVRIGLSRLDDGGQIFMESSPAAKEPDRLISNHVVIVTQVL
jgi:hypothetical protein